MNHGTAHSSVGSHTTPRCRSPKDLGDASGSTADVTEAPTLIHDPCLVTLLRNRTSPDQQVNVPVL